MLIVLFFCFSMVIVALGAGIALTVWADGSHTTEYIIQPSSTP
jgi:hypothetical protein